MKVILARLEGGSTGTAVVVESTLVYTEDDDKGAYNETCPARTVAKQLGKVLGCGFKTVNLKYEDLGIPDAASTWNFDDLAAAAVRRAR